MEYRRLSKHQGCSRQRLGSYAWQTNDSDRLLLRGYFMVPVPPRSSNRTGGVYRPSHRSPCVHGAAHPGYFVAFEVFVTVISSSFTLVLPPSSIPCSRATVSKMCSLGSPPFSVIRLAVLS